MKSIAFDEENGKQISERIRAFFQRYQLCDILRKSNAYKQQGVSVMAIMSYLFCLVFHNRSMFVDMQSGKAPNFRKDTVYRFKNATHINWMHFTTLLSANIIGTTLEPLTSENRRNAFVVDDTIFERNGSRKVELLAKVYDHARHRFTRGFRMLTLGWSDGVTFLPINSCLLSTANQQNRLSEGKILDSRSNGAKAREMATKKGTEVISDLISEAQSAGIQADYVLFDSWFSSPKVIRSMREKNLDVVAMVKQSSKFHYAFQGEKLSCKEIYARCKKRRGRSRYLLSVPIEIGGGEPEATPIPAKLVFVRNRSNRKDYLVLISTDTTLTEDEIIQLYGKRWDIEVFFKTSKSVLHLTGECRSLSYDAMCAQCAIVFARYMFLAVGIRENQDLRSAGPLFCLIADELADISLAEAMEKLQLFQKELLEGFDTLQQNIGPLILKLLADLPAEITASLDLDDLKAVLG